MHIERRRHTDTHRIASALTAAVLCFMTTVTPAGAQARLSTPPTQPSATSTTSAPSATIRQAIDSAAFEPTRTRKQSTPAPHALKGQMHPAGRAAIAAAGAFGGMLAGGYVGAFLEGDSCNCDDPGLKGFLIGMPIGAVLGGIAGWKATK